MIHKRILSLLLVAVLVVSLGTASAQFDPGERPVDIFGVIDMHGLLIGRILVVGETGQGYESGNEYWRFSEEALLGIEEQESLELAVLAQGVWDDPWVAEALGWQPEDTSIEWSHPAEAEWMSQDERLPPVTPSGTYFGNATLGGLTIDYSSRGPSSLTWFKLTEGAFMQLEDGAVFQRDSDIPSTGSWWHGPIDTRR